MTAQPSHDAAPDDRAARWRSIKAIFHDVVDLPAAEQAARLEQLTAGDVSLREEVGALLTADRQTSARLEAVAEPLADAIIGQTVGAYRIEREIGHGGMGTVYLARRTGEFDQQVALKIVRRGMDTALVLHRFVSERQILAGLEHPNIARLFDGGSTADGRPYFVMEYLDALPITEYCDRQALSIEARLRLFLVVCGAVQYAHQQLIVHRDLKPGNVLVTAEGMAKLLDFGVAKLLDDGGSHQATIATQRAITPEYASPEQLLGLACGIPSDVYSLGVILHELLTGSRPAPGDTGSREPASGAAARHRERAPAQAPRRLRGDLDTIIQTSLQRDPQRRYQTVHDFAGDVERHLHSLPILAHPDSWSYRARKFVARHRVAVGAAALVMLSLTTGIVVAARSARTAELERARAQRRFEDVRKLTHSLLFDLHDEIGQLPGNVAVRRHLLARAVEYLDQLTADTSAERSVQLEMATAYDRIGALAFDMTSALDSYRKSATLFERGMASGAGDLTGALSQIRNLHNIGDLQKMMGDVDAALATAARARDIAQRLVDSQGGPAGNEVTAESLHMLERSHSLLGFIAEDVGEHGAALADYGRALDVAEARAERFPDDAMARRRVAVVRTHVGINLEGGGDPRAALVSLGEAERLLRPLLTAEPINVFYQRDLWTIELYAGRARLASGDTAGALGALERALAIKQRLADGDPGDTGHQRGLAVTHFWRAQAFAATGHVAQAQAHSERAMALSGKLASADSSNLESQIDLGEFELGESRLLRRLGRNEQARHYARSADERLRRSAAQSPRNRRVAALLDSMARHQPLN